MKTKKTRNYKKELEEGLKKIGWRLQSIGCGHYAIINNLEKETSFVFSGEKIEFEDRRAFGESKSIANYVKFGWIIFCLKDCKISFDEVTNRHVSIVGNKNKSIFITFTRIETNKERDIKMTNYEKKFIGGTTSKSKKQN